MKTVLILAFSLLTSASAYSNTPSLGNFNLSFAAPVIADYSSVPGDTVFGTIVYDYTHQGFYGLNNAGNWVLLGSSTGTSVTSTGSDAEKMGHLTIAGCTSDPCTITKQSQGFVSSVTHISAGAYTVTFATPFTDIPVCICGITGGNNFRFCNISVPSTTSVSINTFTYADMSSAPSTYTDIDFNMVCIGPR